MKPQKVCKSKKCAGGEHMFIVSRWHIVGQMQVSAGFTCQNCLLSVDGKHDIDKLKESVHESKADDRESKSAAN